MTIQLETLFSYIILTLQLTSKNSLSRAERDSSSHLRRVQLLSRRKLASRSYLINNFAKTYNACQCTQSQKGNIKMKLLCNTDSFMYYNRHCKPTSCIKIYRTTSAIIPVAYICECSRRKQSLDQSLHKSVVHAIPTE